MNKEILSMHQLGLLLSAGIVLALFLIGFLILWFSRNHNQRHPQYLIAAYLFSGAYVIMVVSLIQSRLIFEWPHFHKTAVPFILLTFPLANLYLKKSVRGESLVVKDLAHFIIPLLTVIYFVPYYFDSEENKIKYLAEKYQTQKLLFIHSEVNMGDFNHFLVLTLGMFIWYGISNSVQILRIWKPEFDSEPWKNKEMKRWLTFFYVITMIQPLGNILLLMTNDEARIWHYNLTVMVLMAFVISSVIMISPSILYGIEIDQSDGIPVENPVAKNGDHVIEASIESFSPHSEGPPERSIEDLIRQERIFLAPRVTPNKLAQELKMGRNQLEQLVCQKTGMTLRDFIISLKVDYILQEAEKGNLKDMTLEQIAKLAGFGNRTTFVEAFKKFKGDVPSAILKRHKKVIANKSH